MMLFTGLAKVHTFEGFLTKSGRKPAAEDMRTIEKAAFLVSDRGFIEWIGPEAEWKAWASRKSATWRAKVKKQSLKNCEVLPAFHECHTHLLYAGSRAEEFERRNRGDSYIAIAEAGGGIRSTVLATAEASSKKLMDDLIERLRELAAQGVATVEIKTGYAGTIEEEERHLRLLLKLRALAAKVQTARLPRVVVTCLAAHSIPKGETEATWLKKVETLFPLLLKTEARLDIFIEKSAFSKVGGEALLKKAIDVGIRVTIHADQLSLSGGTELGVKLRAQSVDHVIEAGVAEIEMLATSDTVAVLLPAADLYTRLAYPKARAMLEAGVRVGLATDHNPGTSPGLDIALVGVLARTQMQMTLPEVFCSYTVNAAQALGLGTQLGGIVVGRKADFIVLRPGTSLHDLFYEIGPRRSHGAIESVWRDGQRLVKSTKSGLHPRP